MKILLADSTQNGFTLMEKKNARFSQSPNGPKKYNQSNDHAQSQQHHVQPTSTAASCTQLPAFNSAASLSTSANQHSLHNHTIPVPHSQQTTNAHYQRQIIQGKHLGLAYC